MTRCIERDGSYRFDDENTNTRVVGGVVAKKYNEMLNKDREEARL